jgi:microsomal dipeptidase-like Zn-dependent dipeptidase
VIRRTGLGAKLLDGDNLPAELRRRNYSEEAVGKILGGNLLRVMRQVLPQN